MRLPELDQKAIKVQPLPDVGTGTGEGQVVRDMNRELSEVLVLECDGLECCSHPFDAPRIKPIHHIFELCRFREVDRS
jgi:hypothetical protein